MDRRKLTKSQAQTRADELKVIQSELKSVKKGAKVYKQQQNSNIFFQDDAAKVFAAAKKELDGLIMDYEDVVREETDDKGESEGDSAQQK